MVKYIPIILGSGRKERQSEKVANYVLSELKKNKIKTELLDVRDYHLHATDNLGRTAQAKKLKSKIKDAKSIIIVSPEYNYSYPGELKMMLDLLYEEYFGKKLGICSVSAGAMGGIRMTLQLSTLGVALGMYPVNPGVAFPKVQELFDEKGNIKDPKYSERIKKLLSQLD